MATKVLNISVPLSFQPPKQLELNNPEVNQDILTIGSYLIERQESLLLDKIKDESLKKIIQTRDNYEREIQVLKEEREVFKHQLTQNKQQLLSKFELDIQTLKEENENLKKQISSNWNVFFNDGQEKGKKENEHLIEHLKRHIDEEKQRNNELRDLQNNSIIRELKEINENLQGDFKKKLDGFIDRFTSSAKIGSLGENFVEDYFNNNLSSFNTELIIKNKQKDQGDLRYIAGDLKLMIEVKNVESLTKCDVQKFVDNIETCKNEINAGILISLRDTYLLEGKKGFAFDYYNNIPLIYLGDVLNSPDVIKIAVMILGYLVSHGFTRKDNVDSEEDKNMFLHECIQKMYAQFQLCKNIQDKNKKFIIHLQEQNKLLETTYLNIDSIFKEVETRVREIRYENQYAILNVGKGDYKNKLKQDKNEKFKLEIYEKIKHLDGKATRKNLIDMGYTERQLRNIKIKDLNMQILNEKDEILTKLIEN